MIKVFSTAQIVFDKFRNLLGGRVRIMMTGSAPLDPHILERMRAFFCCWIVEVRRLSLHFQAFQRGWNAFWAFGLLVNALELPVIRCGVS